MHPIADILMTGSFRDGRGGLAPITAVHGVGVSPRFQPLPAPNPFHALLVHGVGLEKYISAKVIFIILNSKFKLSKRLTL